MSSIQSAPAHIPATTAASLGAGLATPRSGPRHLDIDLLVEQPQQDGLLGQRHHRHQPGTRDQMIVIKHPEPAAKPCDTCTDSAFLNRADCTAPYGGAQRRSGARCAGRVPGGLPVRAQAPTAPRPSSTASWRTTPGPTAAAGVVSCGLRPAGRCPGPCSAPTDSGILRNASGKRVTSGNAPIQNMPRHPIWSSSRMASRAASRLPTVARFFLPGGALPRLPARVGHEDGQTRSDPPEQSRRQRLGGRVRPAARRWIDR
jgi:hypothetical protein